jgi:hypothetical protein
MRYLHAFLVCPLLAVNLAINAPAQTSFSPNNLKTPAQARLHKRQVRRNNLTPPPQWKVPLCPSAAKRWS